MNTVRPDTITFLGTLEILLSIFADLGLVALVMINALGSEMFDIFSVLAPIWLISGIGFFQGRQWAWFLGMATAVVSFVTSFFLSLFTILGPVFAPGLIFWPAAIYLLTRPGLKTFFTRSR